MKKNYITKRNSLTSAEVKRDVLMDIFCLAMKSVQVIDFKGAIVSDTTESELSRRY